MPRCGEADGAWQARWRMQYHSDGWYRRGGRGKEEASDERDERRRRPKSIIGLTRHLTIVRRPLSPIALRCSLAVLLSLRQIVIPRRIESCSTSMAPSATPQRERERAGCVQQCLYVQSTTPTATYHHHRHHICDSDGVAQQMYTKSTQPHQRWLQRLSMRRPRSSMRNEAHHQSQVQTKEKYNTSERLGEREREREQITQHTQR